MNWHTPKPEMTTFKSKALFSCGKQLSQSVGNLPQVCDQQHCTNTYPHTENTYIIAPSFRSSITPVRIDIKTPLQFVLLMISVGFSQKENLTFILGLLI